MPGNAVAKVPTRRRKKHTAQTIDFIRFVIFACRKNHTDFKRLPRNLLILLGAGNWPELCSIPWQSDAIERRKQPNLGGCYDDAEFKHKRQCRKGW